MATFTVKGIPDELYRKLKTSAEANHRSINSEIIFRIETGLMPRRVSAQDLLERLRRLDETLGGREFKLEDLDRARRSGRP